MFLILPLIGPQKGPDLYLNKSESHPQACFLPNLVEIGLVVLEKIFQAFLYILQCKSLSPWGGAIHDPRHFIRTKLNLLARRILHAIYQCIPASGS